MPPQKIQPGWPAHFYDEDGNIPCRAKGCKKIFKTEEDFKVPNPHWTYLPDRSLPTYNDHVILQAVHSQHQCALCDFDSEGDLKALFAHETADHRTSKMSSIEGYLSLIRCGRILEIGARWDEAFNRLVGKILESDYRIDVLLKACPNTLKFPPDQQQARLTDFLESENKSIGLDPRAVTPANWFLRNSRPGNANDTAWLKAHKELCSMYEEGTI